MKASINVLMLTYNSSDWIPKVLPPLQSKTVQVRLIVVDGSSDNTVALVKQYFPDAIIIKSSSNNLAYLRNLALRESEKYPNDYTAFIDSDMVVPPNFFERTINFLQPKNIGAVCVGGILNFEGKTLTAKFWRNCGEPLGLQEKNYVCTGSTMFKFEVVKDIVIDEKCKRSDEDVDLCLKVKERGYKILFDNTAPFTVHLRPATVREELKRYVNFGKTRPLTVVKQGGRVLHHTIFTDAFTIVSVILIPIGLYFLTSNLLVGLLCLTPTTMLYGRHTLKLKRKWRVDHVLFSMLLSYVYNILCGVYLVKNYVSSRCRHRK